MGPTPLNPRLVRFGVFEFDLSSGELQRQGRKVRLEGQPVQVLICLLESRGELVTREELHRRLWPADTFVNFEQGLNAAVKRLRQALRDSAENPRFVETLPRRGYRFIAPIEVVEAATAPPIATVIPMPPAAEAPAETAREETAPQRRPAAWAIAGAAVLLVVVGVAIWMLRPAHGPATIRSLAVLPLESLSGDPSQDYFSDGMTDELITELGQISQLRVISRTSMMTYKGTHKSLPEIARELNVDAVVEGTILRSGQQVRITAQLIEAAADKHLWAQSYEGDLGDTLALQKQVARSIAKEIRIELNPREEAVLADTRRVNPDAYENYLKGRYFWNKRTADGFQQAVHFFSEAIEKDAAYAPAYAGLADSYALLGDWEYGVMPPKEAYPKARKAARTALELDQSLGEAHISLAFTSQNYDWDWETAGREFERGLALSPGYATGHHWYAWYLAAMQKNGEAVAEMKKAESLDPLSLIIGADLAGALLIARRYDDAIAQSRKIIGMDPRFAVAHYELGTALVQKGMYDQAIAELRTAVEFSGGASSCTTNLAYAYAVSGRRDDASKMLHEMTAGTGHALSNAAGIALVYVGLHDNDQAMTWLERAYAERFNPSILLRPSFDLLRSDPRFQSLLHRIGLVS